MKRSEARYDVVVLRRNDFSVDGRVERQAASLADDGLRVIVVAVGGTQRPRRERLLGYDLLRLPLDQELGLLPRAWLESGGLATGRSLRRLGTLAGTGLYYGAAVALIRRWRPAVVHCHDLDTLLPGFVGATAVGARVIYDSAELWTERNNGYVGLRRRLDRARYGALEALLIPRVDRVLTVSEGIAAYLARRYGVDRPVVLRNVPGLPAAGLDSPLRAHLGGDAPLLLHLGIVDMHRGLEEVVQALPALGNARLVLLGTARPAVLAELRRIAGALGVEERVVHLPPVGRDEILRWAAGADLGLCLFRPVCLSHALAMPNKLFEYALAGLPIVASDLPDMARYVREHRVGVVCDPSQPASIAAAVRRVLAGAVPRRSGAALREFQSSQAWEHERRILRQVYRGLVPELLGGRR